MGLCVPLLAGRFDRLTDQSVAWIWRVILVPDQCQSTAQQRIHRRRWSTWRQQAPQCSGTPELTHDLEAQGLDARTQRFGDGLELRRHGPATDSGLNNSRCVLKQTPQRRGMHCRGHAEVLPLRPNQVTEGTERRRRPRANQRVGACDKASS